MHSAIQTTDRNLRPRSPIADELSNHQASSVENAAIVDLLLRAHDSIRPCVNGATTGRPAHDGILASRFLTLQKQRRLRSNQTTDPRRPMIKPITKSTKNTTNSILAIVAAVPATTPKPNTPAINAITKKVNAQLNMVISNS